MGSNVRREVGYTRAKKKNDITRHLLFSKKREKGEDQQVQGSGGRREKEARIYQRLEIEAKVRHSQARQQQKEDRGSNSIQEKL